jgi:hypothetical protein
MLAIARTPTKKQTRNQHCKKYAKFILQGPATAHCCCVAERKQSPSLPRRRLGYRTAKLVLALKHGDEKANANTALKNIRKIHLTRPSHCTLLLCCRAEAIAFAPSSPTWLSYCKTGVGPQARRRKSKREYSTEKHPQNSSYKVQSLHSADLARSHARRKRNAIRS